MDAASQHLSKDVLLHARRLNVMLVMIPGKLTYLLQSLDVCLFRVLKDEIKKNQLRTRIINGQGIVPLSERVNALNDSILKVLVNKDWSEAFTKVGANGDFSTLRQGLRYYFPKVGMSMRCR